MEEKLKQISQDFLERIKQSLPEKGTSRSFIFGFIGFIESGKSTAAGYILDKLPNSVLVRSDSARYLLKEADMGWGENVKEITLNAARWLIKNGYTVIFDGDHVDKEKRENTQKLADELNVPFYLIRIGINQETAEKRVRTKYDNVQWESSFEDFRVNTTEKMIENLRAKASLHQKFLSTDTPQLIGEVDNNGSPEDLKRDIYRLIDKMEK